MSSQYDEETSWIRSEAETLSARWNRSYSLVLYRGLNAYNSGSSPEEIRNEMNDYCWSKTAPAKQPASVHSHGTG